MFRRHHYLNTELVKNSRVFLLSLIDGEEEKVIGFDAIIAFPHPRLKNMWRSHRRVILPEYQGLGLGIILISFVGSVLKKEEKCLSEITSNPNAIASYKKSKNWKCVRFGTTEKQVSGKKMWSHRKIPTATFIYAGENED